MLLDRLSAGLKAFMHPARPVVRRHGPQPVYLAVDRMLAQKNVLVTGGARNIGRAIALEMAAHGARVHCTDVDPQGCEKLEDELSRVDANSRVFRSDISKESEIDSLCRSLADAGVHIDVLVNNVGIGGNDWHQVMNTNVIGPMHLTRTIARDMKERRQPGSILFVTSIHQESVHRWSAAYSASKGALGMLIRELALDLARDRIRVNGIAPGFVSEDADGFTVPHGFTPLDGSSVHPSYVGRAAVYLSAEYFSRHTTGTVVTIDGGLSLFNYVCAIEAGLKP
jgi:NAD(P)-dependent dehydrogenase (short-subunit alcohol dehydrogenase family)